MQGGGYNSAPHHGSGLLCVDCVMNFAPGAATRGVGYIGAGRWDRVRVLAMARDLYVPLTPQEAAGHRHHAAHT